MAARRICRNATPVLLVALLLIPATMSAAKSAPSAAALLHISSHSTRPTEIYGLNSDGTPRLELCDLATRRCVLPFIAFDAFTGDATGEDVNVGSLKADLATLVGDGVSLSTFTGTVQGCPSPGTATLRWIVKFGVQPGRNAATFTVVEGSGTGGLEGLVGDGDAIAGLHPDSTVTGEITAHLTCRTRRATDT